MPVRSGIRSRITPWVAALLVQVGVAAVVRGEPGPAAGQDGAKLVDELFGEQLKQVAATREIDDDVTLADLMIQTGLSHAQQHPQLLESVCFRIADELGRRVGGHEVAARALGLLARRKPEMRQAMLERLIEVRKHESTVARGTDRSAALAAVVSSTVALAGLHAEEDRLDEALKLYQEAQSLARRIRMRGTAEAIDTVLDAYRPLIDSLRRAEVLKSKLKANPDDKDAARQLVMLYLLDLDAPAEARKFAFLLADAELESRIKLAGTPIDQLADADAMAMADWYDSLAVTGAPINARQTALRRVCAYLKRYLDAHATADLDRTKAEIRLKTVSAALADLSKPPAKP